MSEGPPRVLTPLELILGIPNGIFFFFNIALPLQLLPWKGWPATISAFVLMLIVMRAVHHNNPMAIQAWLKLNRAGYKVGRFNHVVFDRR